ncbi:hypothetical protein ACQ4PT_050232 [Festuca glaucescens]
MTTGAAATAVDRRRRAYGMLDAAYPDRGYALRWCEQALEMYRADGDTKEARLLLRSALRCDRVADYASIYKAWIAMELHDGNVGAARGLFLEWGRRIYEGAEDDGGGGEIDFWCMFINFEVKNGSADRARAVARAAVEACPSDPTIYAKNLKVELLFRHGDRGVLARHLDNFAMDVDCKDWLVHYQVGACHDHDHHDSKAKRLGGGGFFLGRMCRGVKRLVHPHGYQPLHEASTLSV